ncbi:MAG: phosphate propanoyltransferase [Bacillota bacterium]|nr:phosphate propanoyltransferase [Bacillota bacterium]
MIITEYELRANWYKNKEKVIVLAQGSVITPSARDFIRSKGIEVQIEGEGIRDITRNTFSNAKQSTLGSLGKADSYRLHGASTTDSAPTSKPVKPEHMTHLHNSELVEKTHPVIALRGKLDLFQCELVDVQLFLQDLGEEKLVQQLEEIADFARQLMVCEVKQEPFVFTTLIGLNPNELREHSHFPQKYYGVSHTPLSYTYGKVVAKLNLLRSRIREVELQANKAFTDKDGNCTRGDLVQAYNRLSSTFYIMACEFRGRAAQVKKVPIGISNRHVHLSQEDLQKLFGDNYSLRVKKELSQLGEFAAEETLTLVGPKGRIEGVRILGPIRKQTQVEVSVTDCFRIGVKPTVRDSGQLENTPGLTLIGEKGSVELGKGVIVAGRHIHLHTEDAKQWNLKNGDKVQVKVNGERQVIFGQVLVRVSDNYRKEMHLDTDEANSVLIGPSNEGLILGVCRDE